MSKQSRFFGGAVVAALTICVSLTMMIIPAWAVEPGDIYAMYYKNGQTVVCEDGTEVDAYTLVLQNDNVPDSTHDYGEYDESQGGLVTAKTETVDGGERRGWTSEVDAQVTNVIVRDVISPDDTYAWFSGMDKCVSMDLSKLDTSNVANMSYMFSNCTTVESIPVSHFEMSNVVEAEFMFAHCESLKKLDVSSWNTSKMTTAEYMFWVCQSLELLDVSKWDTSSLAGASGMFSCCYSLKKIDVSKWDVSNLEWGILMFKCCQSLESIDISKWNSPKLSMVWEMFGQCYSLSELKCEGWIAPNIKMANAMFIQCESLRTLDLSSLSMASAISLPNLFYGCTSLEVLDLSGWDTSAARANERVEGIFEKCRALSLVKLGAKTNIGSELPTPDPHYIPHATGKWINEEGETFIAANIPAGVAATYAAEGSIAAAAFVKAPDVVPPGELRKASLAKASVTVRSKAWTGKTQKSAAPTVKIGGKTLRNGVDFAYTCKAGKAVGSYKVTVTGKGAYTGTKTATFKIVPKGTSVSKLAKGKKAFTVKWKKPSKAALKQTTGYQVRWSTAKSMKGAKSKTVKAASASGKRCTLKVAKLKAGKKYYVQVRTYKKVGGKTYYSAWSKAKAVKVR